MDIQVIPVDTRGVEFGPCLILAQDGSGNRMEFVVHVLKARFANKDGQHWAWEGPARPTAAYLKMLVERFMETQCSSST